MAWIFQKGEIFQSSPGDVNVEPGVGITSLEPKKLALPKLVKSFPGLVQDAMTGRVSQASQLAALVGLLCFKTTTICDRRRALLASEWGICDPERLRAQTWESDSLGPSSFSSGGSNKIPYTGYLINNKDVSRSGG